MLMELNPDDLIPKKNILEGVRYATSDSRLRGGEGESVRFAMGVAN